MFHINSEAATGLLTSFFPILKLWSLMRMSLKYVLTSKFQTAVLFSWETGLNNLFYIPIKKMLYHCILVERLYVYKIHIISGFNRGPIVWLRNSERIYLVQPTTHYKLRGPAGLQGCVLSPILFSVHANNIFIQDCLCKYASNAALVGLSRRVKASAWAMCCVVMQNSR